MISAKNAASRRVSLVNLHALHCSTAVKEKFRHNLQVFYLNNKIIKFLKWATFFFFYKIQGSTGKKIPGLQKNDAKLPGKEDHWYCKKIE